MGDKSDHTNSHELSLGATQDPTPRRGSYMSARGIAPRNGIPPQSLWPFPGLIARPSRKRVGEDMSVARSLT
ncbi:hypothetical protein Pan181_33040 [Aeoliella mucimassa]|uniref:Uncharacterized protein n=1 Tax=Aeoliella mucimassa TaxID=2527972 RepID=A0A518AQT1_9BACT|nr:hypothetical protein Pan181_33040 [Aeoliella mucimassa]